MSYSVERYHDISCGHRVVGHEGKCRHLHGHNYRIHFKCVAEELDDVGRVIDFGVIKEQLCMWLERNWDHKTILWRKDSAMQRIHQMFYFEDLGSHESANEIQESFVFVDFNPTAENMARHLVEIVGPKQLDGTGVKLIHCRIEETRKCSASYEV